MAAHDPLRMCPNPECKTPGAPQMARYQCYRVCCEGCGMEGPMALTDNTKREAARLWNVLPRAEGHGDG